MRTEPDKSPPWTLARRAARMNPSVIREILKITERPGIISFGGGLPSAKTFPVTEFAAACAKVLRDDAPGALQYAASEGFRPLVEMVAAALPWPVDPDQVLITTGSQQGLDLVAKVLIDSASRVLVEMLQAKQASDLHSPGFNQRMIAEVMKDGFLARHVPTIRALYKAQRDAMLVALEREMPHGEAADPERGVTWNRPEGGMFLWARLPRGMSAVELLPRAVAKGVAFVPGVAFYADQADERSLRLSFVTPSVAEIERGVAALAAAVREAMPAAT